jgi:hypothetical protein
VEVVMSCCGQSVSQYQMGNFGTAGCRGIEPFLENLSSLLSEAQKVGISGDPIAVGAQSVYDDINGYVLYVPLLGDACEKNTAEVQAAISRLTPVVASAGGSTTLPRPDAAPPSSGPPTWMIVGGFGILGVAALHYLSPILSSFTKPKRKYAGYRRSKR